MLLFRVCRQSLKVANWCQHFFEQNFDHHCLTDEQTLKRALLPHFPTPQAPMVLNSGPFRTSAYGRPHALSNLRIARNDARPNYRRLLVAVRGSLRFPPLIVRRRIRQTTLPAPPESSIGDRAKRTERSARATPGSAESIAAVAPPSAGISRSPGKGFRRRCRVCRRRWDDRDAPNEC